MPPKEPNPPAAETAAARVPPLCSAIGADITGYERPNISVNLVRNIVGYCYKQNPNTTKNRNDPHCGRGPRPTTATPTNWGEPATWSGPPSCRRVLGRRPPRRCARRTSALEPIRAGRYRDSQTADEGVDIFCLQS